MSGRYESTPSYSSAQQAEALRYLYLHEENDTITPERLEEIKEDCEYVGGDFSDLYSQLYKNYDVYTLPTQKLVRLLCTYFWTNVDYLKLLMKSQDELWNICYYWFKVLRPLLNYQADNDLAGYFKFLAKNATSDEDRDRNRYFVEKIKEYGPVEL